MLSVNFFSSENKQERYVMNSNFSKIVDEKPSTLIKMYSTNDHLLDKNKYDVIKIEKIKQDNLLKEVTCAVVNVV